MSTASARLTCEQHHWVSRHQPDLPLYWITRCSLCGDYQAEGMRREIRRIPLMWWRRHVTWPLHNRKSSRKIEGFW